jgi:hypothetical protein
MSQTPYASTACYRNSFAFIFLFLLDLGLRVNMVYTARNKQTEWLNLAIIPSSQNLPKPFCTSFQIHTASQVKIPRVILLFN